MSKLDWSSIGTGLATNLGGAVIGTAANFGLSAYNNHLAEKAADRQYERQLEFWEKQNEYNSPESQRERLEAAGLNSAAVLSGGVQDTSATPVQVPGNDYAKNGAMPLGQIADTMVKFAQAANLNADAEMKGAQTLHINTERDFKQLYLNVEKEFQDIKIDTDYGKMSYSNYERLMNSLKSHEDYETSSYQHLLTKEEYMTMQYLYDNGFRDIRLQLEKNALSVSNSEVDNLAAMAAFSFTRELGGALGKFAPVGEVLLNLFKIWISTKR